MFTEITKERGSKNKKIKLGTTNRLKEMTDEKGELLPIFKKIKTNFSVDLKKYYAGMIDGRHIQCFIESGVRLEFHATGKFRIDRSKCLRIPLCMASDTIGDIPGEVFTALHRWCHGRCLHRRINIHDRLERRRN